MGLSSNNPLLLTHQTITPTPPLLFSSTFGAVAATGLWLHTFSNSALNFSNQILRHRHCRPSRVPSVSVPSRTLKPKANADEHKQRQLQREEEEEQEDEFQLLSSIRSNYNDIMIVDTQKSRMLLLDSSYNVHSILHKHQKWTDSYWDQFASLPPIIPQGPIAILGLGGGTAAHLMLDLWPALQLEGWEIDQILIDKARIYFGLSDLEKHTKAGGILNVHVGDALSPSVNIPGGYAGIVVDLFSDGEVLPQLQEVGTWLEISNWLMPNGRIMVNCGGTSGGSEADLKSKLSNGINAVQNSTIKAMSKAFPGQVSWKRMPRENGDNFLALTGQLPDLDSWSGRVPTPLSASVKQWRLYEEI
ncbi:hypothetical protein UlMin_024022 [Ulmus minor]